MTIAIIIILVVAAIIAAAYFAERRRAKAVRQHSRRYGSTCRLNRLTQQTFNKALNIVSDLVANDGADIQVVYEDEVVFNGYVDRNDQLESVPIFGTIRLC